MSLPLPPKYPAEITPRPGLIALANRPAGTLIPPPIEGCGYQSRDLLELSERGYLAVAKRSLTGMWIHRVHRELVL